ncbi:MAG: DUF4031 domain-containing protein [Ktedonobacterales bacterium]
MAILIHAARATRHWLPAGVYRGQRMYHVVSDIIGPEGSHELRAFVQRYGLRPEWVQYAGTYREHFDVREDTGLRMLEDVIARQVTNRELGALLSAKRAALPPS